MPSVTLPITPAGPIVPILVGVNQPWAQQLRTSGQPVPPAVLVQLVADTGASCTCLDPTVLAALGLSPTGSTSIHTPSTGAAPHTVNQYDVSLNIQFPTLMFSMSCVPVIESHLLAQGIQGLLGRDMLAHALLIYNGPAGTFVLSF
jgi:hypothetical protein